MDPNGLAARIYDTRWSNEGLFALVVRLRRLKDLDNSGRVAAPESACFEAETERHLDQLG